MGVDGLVGPQSQSGSDPSLGVSVLGGMDQPPKAHVSWSGAVQPAQNTTSQCLIFL